jgi:hypothetical protein
MRSARNSSRRACNSWDSEAAPTSAPRPRARAMRAVCALQACELTISMVYPHDVDEDAARLGLRPGLRTHRVWSGLFCSVLEFGPVPTSPTPLLQGAPVRLLHPVGRASPVRSARVPGCAGGVVRSCLVARAGLRLRPCALRAAAGAGPGRSLWRGTIPRTSKS